jgi:putative SOS response-associated peptidase YedK
MCGRFTLRTSAKLLATWFQEVDFPVIMPRYNIAPSQRILALRSNSQRKLEAVMLRWGLVPSWAADQKIGNQLINARSETAASKPAFRRAFKSRRCVILADGFYEWKQTSSGKQPFLIQSTDLDRPLLCFAGLWERWHQTSPATVSEKSPSAKSSTRKPARQLDLFESSSNNNLPIAPDLDSTSETIESCTILTTSANQRMAALHNRMPVILDSKAQTIWLEQDVEDLGCLNSLLQPCPSDQLRIHAVSKLVNKPAMDDPICVEPVSYEEL